MLLSAVWRDASEKGYPRKNLSHLTSKYHPIWSNLRISVLLHDAPDVDALLSSDDRVHHDDVHTGTLITLEHCHN